MFLSAAIHISKQSSTLGPCCFFAHIHGTDTVIDTTLKIAGLLERVCSGLQMYYNFWKAEAVYMVQPIGDLPVMLLMCS